MLQIYFILVFWFLIYATFGTNFKLCRCFSSVTNKLKQIMLKICTKLDFLCIFFRGTSHKHFTIIYKLLLLLLL